MHPFNLLLESIRALPRPAKRPLIIAVSGFGGSGKSTLAEKLQEALEGSAIVSMDAFGIDRLRGRSGEWASFDRERLRSEVLEPAQNGGPIRYQEYDWDRNEIIGWREANPASHLIIEGCSVLHPDLLEYYDFTIWIDCALEKASARGMARDRKWGYDNDAEWKTTWMPNEREFFAKYRPDMRALHLFPCQED